MRRLSKGIDLSVLTAGIADRYRIERELGRGGMATVYVATDVRHRRHVALKVLHPELSAVLGPERFLEEIELTASLQHPHILPLFDSGSVDGRLFYVMPFIEGETLRARLERERQLPIDSAVAIAREVADALQYAHDRSVIHRDIKPENILLQGGHAVVADFGIALAVEHAGGERMTQSGISLGTPQYMSPEQATGETNIDARADVYALGAVTYEMLAGEPPFTGPTARAIIARALTAEPVPLTETRTTVPAHVEHAVLAALAKAPADRWRSAREFAEAITARGSEPHRRQFRPSAVSGRQRVLIGALATATLLAASLAAWGWFGKGRSDNPPVTRVRVAMAPGQEMDPAAYLQRFDLSPDGSRLVYVGVAPNDTTQLWVRERDALEARPVPGTLGAIAPAFSPDGQGIVFVSGDRKLRRIALGGGDAVAVADSLNPVDAGATWLADGTIVFTGVDGKLYRVGASGGRSAIAGEDSRLSLIFPARLPRNDALLATGCADTGCSRMEIGIVDLRTTRFHRVQDDAVRGWYSPTGHIVFVRKDGHVFALPFDVRSLEVRGAPIAMFDGVLVAGFVPSLALADDGTLLYVAGGAVSPPATIIRLSRTGAATPLDPSWDPAEIGPAVVSPDGKQAAVAVVKDGVRSDIWIKQLDRGALTRLTTDGEVNLFPAWLPDGSVGYVSSAGGWHLRFRRADGTGPVGRIDVGNTAYLANPIWSPDGKWVLYERTISGRSRIDARRIGTDSVVPLVQSPAFDATGAALSPNGQWVAYGSNESGHFEVYVRPFPDATRERHQVSLQGGQWPAWSADGRELYFVSDDGRLMATPVTSTPRFLTAEPAPISAPRAVLVWGGVRSYEPERGGRSFLVLRPDTTATVPQLVMAVNWFSELRAKVGLE